MKKVLTYGNIVNQKIIRTKLTGEFYEAFKNPQKGIVWFIWGKSGSGKSSFTMQLAKEYATEPTLYIPSEEGTDDGDFVSRCEYLGMVDVKENFFAQNYNYEELSEYLSKRNAPKTVIIDSATYFFKNFEDYYNLCRKNRKTTFIITGHADGSKPKTQLEKDIKFDANQKVYVEGYVAKCQGRTIGPNGGKFIVWKEKYEELNGAIIE